MDGMNNISILIIIAFLSIFGCKTAKMEHEQGIMGRTYWLEGNQMPMIVEDDADPVGQEMEAVQRIIRVYELTNMNQASNKDGLFTDIETKLVAEAESDEEGSFQIGLPPGRYSVFTVEEEGLFASIFDQNLNINPVEVTADEWVIMSIKIDYKAFY